jgi:ferrous iron transport protein A
MSAVTRRLAGRTLLGPPMSTTGRAVTTLADLAPGARARIVGYAADAPPSTSRRLFDLGFAPGAVIDVVRRAPAQDPVVYRVAECEMAIRTVLARTLLVEGL